MSTVGVFRESLCRSLEAAYGFEFVSGPRDEAQENQDLGCVWMEGKRPFAGDGNMEEVIYGVRVLRYWMQEQDDNEDGRNVVNLENDVELLQTTLAAVLLTAGHNFFNLGGVTVNYENQWVEASLVAYQRNMGATGG